MAEEKKVSVTDLYKDHLQAIVLQELGVKVAKDKAWKLFKAIIKGTAQFVANTEGNKLSLAGVGKFEIRKSPARGKKEEAGYPFIPRFRFKPSTVIADSVEKMMGVGDHADLVLEDFGTFKKADTCPAPVEAEPVAAPAEAPAPQAAPADDFFSL